MIKDKIKIPSDDLIVLEYNSFLCKDVLPSKGEFYRANYIYIRGLRFREMMEISSVAQGTDDPTRRGASLKRVKDIYSNCIKFPEDSKMTFSQMLEEDFIATCFWIVLLTSEAKYEMKFQCEGCGAEVSRDIDILRGDLEFKDFTEFKTKTMQTSLGTLILAPTTVGDTLEAISIGLEDDEFLSDALMIKKLDGKDLSPEQRLSIFNNLTVDEVSKLSQLIDGYKSDTLPIDCKCSKCGAITKMSPSIDILKGLP